MKDIFIEFEYLLSQKNKKVKDVFEDMGYSHQTYYNRLGNPENFTLAELRILANESGISNEKLGEIIKKSKPNHRPECNSLLIPKERT